MIEGIDYYPKKKKSKANIKLWFFVLLIIAVLIYLVFNNNNQSVKKQNSTLIIISEPVKNIDKKQNKITQTIVVEPRTENISHFEKLDEVAQTYNKSNQ